jgi:hypothetical protein
MPNVGGRGEIVATINGFYTAKITEGRSISEPETRREAIVPVQDVEDRVRRDNRT